MTSKQLVAAALAGEAVVILKDGKEFTISFDKLSPPSVEQTRRLGQTGAQPQAPP